MVAVWFMCGNSYGLGGEASTEQCDTPCPLGPGKCGGLLRSSVYQTTAPGGSYLGCFIDNEKRDLPLLIQAQILCPSASNHAQPQVFIWVETEFYVYFWQ